MVKTLLYPCKSENTNSISKKYIYCERQPRTLNDTSIIFLKGYKDIRVSKKKKNYVFFFSPKTHLTCFKVKSQSNKRPLSTQHESNLFRGWEKKGDR